MGRRKKVPKINQEEYEVLKGLDHKYKYEWIARDKFEGMFLFVEKPYKHECFPQWRNQTLDWKVFETEGFQFIQWEDEEPYNIAELIKEYEYSAEHVSHVVNERVKALGKAWSESEETEVKSKQELIGKWESAIESAEFYGKGKEERLISYMKDFVRDLNQLDEPEVLSEEWIEENKEDSGVHYIGYYVPIGRLHDLLVPKQELPVIPKFVAEWIEKYVEYGYDLYPALKKMENNARSWERIYGWYRNNTLEFVLAYLTQEYEIEEEQKYVVELPNPNNQIGRHKNVFLNKKDGKVFIDSANLFVNDITKYGQFALTEEEIKKRL